MSNYDSKQDTLEHINRVQELMQEGIRILSKRAEYHDQSKLGMVEKELFDIYTPILKQLEYGTEGYKKSLEALKPALEHHYQHNSHHPEHYPNGMSGFDLFDLMEMFFDWKAATERTQGGDIYKSIGINQKRFDYPDMIRNIFENTAKRLNY